MTNYVKRGAGRATHAEKTNRHAQRTPLPPKPGQVEAAKEVIAAAQPETNFSSMTVAALRAYARDHEMSTVTKLTRKPELVAAITKVEASRQAIAKKNRSIGATMRKAAPAKKAPAKKVAPLVAPSTSDGRLTTETIVAKLGGTKSDVKAASFARVADSLGWRVDTLSSRDDHTEVTAQRGSEEIHIGWVGGVFIYDECLYTYASHTPIKLRNASAAKKRMTMSEKEADQEAGAKRSARGFGTQREPRSSGKDGSPVEKPKRSQKFGEAMLDEDVLDSVRGHKITWINRISGAEESDRVPTPDEHRRNSQAQAKMGEGNDGRFISFLGLTGFRTVLVSSIIHVGR